MQLTTIFALVLASFHLCSSEPIPRAEPNVAAETLDNEARALPQLAPDSRLIGAAGKGDGNKIPCAYCYIVCIPFVVKCGDKCFPDKWYSKACKVSDPQLPSDTRMMVLCLNP